MKLILQILRSQRLALIVLCALPVYCASVAWLPWVAAAEPAPDWARRTWLDKPFAAPWFFALVTLLFSSTAACFWSRMPSTVRLWRGQAAGIGVPLPSRDGKDVGAFLAAAGFRPRGQGLFRFRPALWAGFLLHVGLLALMLGVGVQQAFHDGGAFEISEGEVLRLDTPGAVFGRERGPLAPARLPEIRLGLVSFDPFLHQPGYAPDRASRLRVELPGARPFEGVLDRADGLEAGPLTVYQAIPSGLALNLEIEGLGVRSLHLRSDSAHSAVGSFDAPGGIRLRCGVDSERRLDDPRGTGALRVWAVETPRRFEIRPGVPFGFGTARARLVSVGRWGGFSFARSPGMSAVHAGFALVLLGATLLALPAGVAEAAPPGEAVAAWVYVARGREVLLAEWEQGGPARG